jgi:hypothetical protein
MSTHTATIDTLRALSAIISNGINTIDTTCTDLKLQFPSPDDPFTPSSHAPHLDPKIIEASSAVISATTQIAAIVRPAPVTVFQSALQVRLFVCILYRLLTGI